MNKDKYQYKQIITNEEISQFLNLNINQNSFEYFLKEFYRDLLMRSNSNKIFKNISKITFQESILNKFPLFISEKLFYSFSNDKSSEFINKEDFIKGFLNLYSNNIEERLNIICKILDFNLDNVISIDDVSLFLATFYQKENDLNNFKEISKLIYKDLPYKKRITINSFKEIINEFNPDVFYLISFYFDKYCPFNIEQINYFKNNNKNIKNNFKKSSKNNLYKNAFLNISPSKNLINFFKKNNINITFDNINFNETLINDISYSDLNSLNNFEEDLNKIKNDSILIENIECHFFSPKKNKSKTKKISNDNFFEKSKTNYSESTNISNFSSKNNIFQNNNLIRTKTNNLYNLNKKFEIHKSNNDLNRFKSFNNNLNYNKNYIVFENKNNYLTLDANFYTNNNSILKQQCKLMLIDNIIYIHTFENLNYNYNKLILLSFSFLEEMEDLITINNDLISRFKIISYLNGFYNEIIFSSNNKIEMICFLNGIKKVINKNIIWEKYSKIKEIHNSNKSKIFLGKNLNNNKNVIIKIIEQNKIINNLIYENIIWEYTIMNYLVTNSHPNIIKVYDCYRDSNGFYYVMEYIKNGNLSNFLKEHQKKKDLNLKNKTTIMSQISNSLLFLHNRGIIHRNLNLENILIHKDNKNRINVKIIDFGFSRILGKLDNLSESLNSLNSFKFSSPQIINKLPYNFKADIWSIGIIFYFILYNKYPFENDNKFNKLKIINDKNNTYNNIINLIQKCLIIDQKKRPKIEDIIMIINK